MKWLISLFLLFVLSSCVRYNATALSNLPCEAFCSAPLKSYEGVKVAARAFTKADCREHLDRNVISKGYQPIQLYLENTTDDTFLFSPARVDLPLATSEEVSRKVHSSTVGRVAGYGAAALIASPLFAVPAVIDGYKSAKANDTLDQDYAAKGAKEEVLPPHAHMNMVLFVPKKSFQETFTLTLINQQTHLPVKVVVSTR